MNAPNDLESGNDPNRHEDAKDAPLARRSRARYLWVVGACVYVGIVWYVGWDSFRAALASVRPIFLLWITLSMLAGIWLRVLKWRLALGLHPQIIPLYFMSKLAGNLSPSRIGELSPLLIRRHRTPQVAAWIVVDRLLEIAATLAFGAAGAVALGTHSRGMLPMVAVAAVLLIVLPVFLITRRNLFLWLVRLTPEASAPHAMATFLADATDEVRLLRPKLPLAGTLTVIATGIDIFTGMLAYRSVGYTLPLALLTASQCMHALLSAVPFLPNATGIPYAAVGVLINRVAGVPYETLAAMITVYFLLLMNAVFWASMAFGLWISQEREEPPSS